MIPNQLTCRQYGQYDLYYSTAITTQHVLMAVIRSGNMFWDEDGLQIMSKTWSFLCFLTVSWLWWLLQIHQYHIKNIHSCVLPSQCHVYWMRLWWNQWEWKRGGPLQNHFLTSPTSSPPSALRIQPCQPSTRHVRQSVGNVSQLDRRVISILS